MPDPFLEPQGDCHEKRLIIVSLEPMQTHPARNDSSSPEISDRIRSLALAIGFDRVGICSAEPSSETRFLRGWLENGYAADMEYIGRRVGEREDPALLMPNVRSIIAVALAYDPPRAGASEASAARARIASYVGVEDYHRVMVDRLHALSAGMGALVPDRIETRVYVDTGPVLEKVFAARAGLGWQGKNTCLIDRQLGSRMLLGVILCDRVLEPHAAHADHCGNCRACLEACPTQAFPEPYVLDARLCISYTTIENRGPISEALRESQGTWVFGCDICQDVCPWNRGRSAGDLPDPLGLRERLAPDPRWVAAELRWILTLDETSWRSATQGSALRRSHYRGLIRNALVAAGNSGDSQLIPLIRAFAGAGDPLLAEHAAWALERLGGGDASPADAGCP